MKNVLLKFRVQYDMLSTCAQSEHTFTCSAEQQTNNPQTNVGVRYGYKRRNYNTL